MKKIKSENGPDRITTTSTSYTKPMKSTCKANYISKSIAASALSQKQSLKKSKK